MAPLKTWYLSSSKRAEQQNQGSLQSRFTAANQVFYSLSMVNHFQKYIQSKGTKKRKAAFILKGNFIHRNNWQKQFEIQNTTFSPEVGTQNAHSTQKPDLLLSMQVTM